MAKAELLTDLLESAHKLSLSNPKPSALLLNLLVISLQTILHHVILWGSILLSFLWYFVLGSLKHFLWDMYIVPFVTMATMDFWAVCAISAVLALLPR